jgi:elongation factor Ts
MPISAEDVKKLRDKTGQSMMECKKALEASGGNADKAIEILRTKGLATAQKRAGRVAAQGRIHAYIHHNGRVGVIVEVDCETDFVAKNETFQAFLNDLCLHICALGPICVRREEIPPAIIEREKRIARDQVAGKKPDNVIEKIVAGKLGKWCAENVLLEQPFVKDQERTVQAVLTELIAKTGENIVIRRFARFEVGETAAG